MDLKSARSRVGSVAAGGYDELLTVSGKIGTHRGGVFLLCPPRTFDRLIYRAPLSFLSITCHLTATVPRLHFDRPRSST